MKVYFDESVISRKTFDYATDYDEYPQAAIRCVRCGNEIGLSLKHFRKYFLNSTSKLKLSDDKAISNFVSESKELSELYKNSFVDYYCPQCANPIRVYFYAGVGGKGTFGAGIVFVIEGQ